MHSIYYMFHNKTVATIDQGLLIALASGYKPTYEWEPYPSSKRILFLGRTLPNLKQRLERTYESFIQVTSSGEIRLTNNTEIITFVLSRHDKKPAQNLLDLVETLDDKELHYYAKQTWVTGKFPIKITKDTPSIYDLYRTIPGPQLEMIRQLLKILEELPHNVVESSLLTLLLRVKEIDEQEVSPRYKMLLSQINTQMGRRLVPAVTKYAELTGLSKELSLIYLLTTLRGR